MPAGRKSKYYSHVEPYLAEIKEMAKCMTEQAIAGELKISHSSLIQYKKDHPELREAIEGGRKTLITDLRSALLRKAEGYSYTEVKETSQKVHWPDDLYERLKQAGLSVQEIDQARIIKTEATIKHAAPDVAAINLALKNYDRGNWWNDPALYDLKKEALEIQRQKLEKDDW